MQELFLAAVVLLSLIFSTALTVFHLKLLKIHKELMGLLASRSYSEYALGQERLSKIGQPQKPDASYEGAWGEENENG